MPTQSATLVRKPATSVATASGRVWLNVASSTYVIDHFINLDNHIVFQLLPFYPLLRPFLSPPKRAWFQEFKSAKARATLVRNDCRKRLPFAAESVDHIICSHFLEHVYPDQAMLILQDFRRVLKPGGTLHVVVPSLDDLIDSYRAASPSDPDAADRLLELSILSHMTRPSLRARILEFLGFEGMKHRWMYTRRSMSTRLESLGFRLLSENTTPSAQVRANDGPSSLHLVAEKADARG